MYHTVMNDADELTIALDNSDLQSKEKIALRLLLASAVEFARNLQIEQAETVINLFKKLFNEREE